jgi:signal transduction histidine kinase
MRWPIRNQIMFPLLAVAVCSLAAVGTINAVLTERRTSAHIEGQIRGVVGVLTTSSFPLTESVLRQMRDLSGAEFVVRASTGPITASTLPVSELLPEQPVVARIEDVSLGHTATIAGRSYFHTIVKIPAASGRSGVLHVLFPKEEYRKAWRQAFIPSLVIGAATLAAMAVVAQLLASRMGRTTAQLREEVTRLARGDYRPVNVPAVNDEFRDLSLAVNRTAEMLTDYEAQVRRTEQMRTATMLGASVAHQVRNAVTGCRMALDLHREECPADGDAETLEVAQRQLVLIERQLQRFLRIGKPAAQNATRDVDLAELIDDTLPLIRPAAQHAGVELACQIASRPLTVRGDEDAIQQVVLNLLLNAIEAAHQNGIKRHGERRVCIEAGARRDGMAAMTISDSGAGPDERVAGSIFEPFVTDKPEGAGLGLAVAKEVVAAHGGSIVWTRENEATRFLVELPLTMNGHARVENPDC